MKYNFDTKKEFDINVFCKEDEYDKAYDKMNCEENTYEEDYRSFAYYDII